MSERTQHWLPSEQFGVPVDYNTGNEQLIQGSWVQGYYSTYSTAAPSELQRQPVSSHGIPLAPHSGYTSHTITLVHPLIHDGTHPYMIEEQDNMDPEHDHLPGQELTDINIADQFHLSFSGNELSSPGDVLQPFLRPSSGAAGPTTTEPLAHSPVGISAGPRLIELVAAEHDLRAVGSPQIQQAACKRRKRDRIYQCPFRNAGCNSTFTALHNLRYHLNAHRNLKPYKCTKCSYAANSPASVKDHALRRHPSSCKGKVQSTKGMSEPGYF